MGRVTANHRYIYREIGFQRDTYLEVLEQYEKAFQAWVDDKGDFESGRLPMELSQRLQGIKFSIVINVAAFVEAMINFHLSNSLSSEQFQKIERKPPAKKWLAEFNRIDKRFSIDTGTEPYHLVEKLFETRNSIMHMKPTILDENKQEVHRGLNPQAICTQQDDKALILSWNELPNSLLKRMEECLPEPEVRLTNT